VEVAKNMNEEKEDLCYLEEEATDDENVEGQCSVD
jgi:hypothetical protein